jgi:hypothetical protein
MHKKQKKLLDDSKLDDQKLSEKKLLEVRISDSLTNLEEFARIMTDDIDFTSFDVLSVTRIDTETPYTKKFSHRRLDTQTYRIFSDASKNMRLGISIGTSKNKLN